MTHDTPPKDFDCIEFKRAAQARIYEQIKDLSPEEELAYYHRAVEEGPFAEWWKRASAATAARRRDSSA